MCTLFLPNWAGLSLLTHHCRGGGACPRPVVGGCAGGAGACVNTVGAPLNMMATATASGTCERLMYRSLIDGFCGVRVQRILHASPFRRAMRRTRGPRIFGPRMFRIAPTQLLAHLRIRARPKAAQISRRLHRAAVRREQMKCDGHARRADRRRLGESEELLQLYRRGNRAVLGVFERHCAAARYYD